jgi:hypothetical protein
VNLDTPSRTLSKRLSTSKPKCPIGAFARGGGLALKRQPIYKRRNENGSRET